MREISFEFKIPQIKFSHRRKFQIKLALSSLIVLGAFLLQQKFDYTFVGTLILIYLGISMLWGLSSRIAAAGALLFLAGCPVLLILKNDALAEIFAVYAYYLLVVTVLQEIVLLIKDRKKGGVDNFS